MSEHSPLGASGAHRWMECPASVGLSRGVTDAESDHASLGTAAHAVAAYCLASESDAWEQIGQIGHAYEGGMFYPHDIVVDGGIIIDKDMADAVQVYLDAVRTAHPDRNQGNTWVERRFHCPSIHPLFFGTSDLIYWDAERKVLHTWDYKHGVGVVVEAPGNPQLMYYGVGALTDLALWREAETVVLHVAQPRAFHHSGPIREWAISVVELAYWRNEVLIPAMLRAMDSRESASGEHCRFCPVRGRKCPQLMKDAEEWEAMVKKVLKEGAPALTNEELARFLDLSEVLKIAFKAARETAFAKAEGGAKIPGWKLVKARSNREWKEGAYDRALEEFGPDALTEPVLKSPALIDKLPKGTAFTAREAFKPEGGMQLVQDRDARSEAGPAARSMFKPTKEG